MPIYFSDKIIPSTHYQINKDYKTTYQKTVECKFGKTTALNIDVIVAIKSNTSDRVRIYKDFYANCFDTVQFGSQSIILTSTELYPKNRVAQIKNIHHDEGRLMGLRNGDKCKITTILTTEGFKCRYHPT